MAAYYNEFDPFAASWLENLIADGLVAPGIVDRRSIVDVQAGDLKGYGQCHFFAGIGGWSLALRLAGVSDDDPWWSCSCPCPPYSVASVGVGGAKGQDDSRDLWPEMPRFIREYRPARIVGEQVADAIAWGWWDRVALDMEAEDYAACAVVLRADAFRARHRRRRVYWNLADTRSEGREGYQPLQRLSVTAPTPFSKYGDALAGAGRALDGDYSDLLPSDGLSVVVERHALRGYGNAIVPQVAAEFIRAVMECRPLSF
jgi:DNA (cytosine-5)-methyltransferase 1